MEFSKDTTPMYNKYVNLVLNTLTSNEHDKYVHHLSKQKLAVKQETADSGSRTATPNPPSTSSKASEDVIECMPVVATTNSSMASSVTPIPTWREQKDWLHFGWFYFFKIVNSET
jgi:hypothetical protein